MKNFSKMDNLIIYFILCNLLFLRYIKVLYTELYIFDLFIVIYIFMKTVNKKRDSFNLLHFFSIIMVGIALIINMGIYGFGKIYISNLIMTLSPLTYIIFLIYIVNKYNIYSIENLVDKLRYILNMYFFINCIIIFLQIKTQSFMMRKFLSFNPYFQDHTDGLIGANGVAVLNFLWIATLLLNYYYLCRNKQKRTLILLIIEFAIMCVISSFNDNKMFLLTLIPIILFILVININRIKLNVSYKKLFFVFFLIPTFLIIIFWTRSLLYNVFLDSNELIQGFYYSKNYIPNQNNERAYLNYLAFNQYNAKSIGVGLQNVDINNQNIHKHLGINSSSLLLIQGGIIYYLSIINLYCVLLLKLFNKSRPIQKIIFYVLLFLTLLTFSFATQPFRDHYIAMSLMFVYLSLYLTHNRTKYFPEA